MPDSRFPVNILARWQQIKFGLHNQRTLILAFVLCAIAAMCFVQPFPFSNAPSVEWYNGWNVVISLATLAVAVLVWASEIQQDWTNSLPKRLHVDFYLRDQPLMVVRDATLIAESDMRNWAMQLGAQIIGGQRKLRLKPTLRVDPPACDPIRQIQEFYLRLDLDERPQFSNEIEQLIQDSDLTHPVLLLEPGNQDGNHLRIVAANSVENFAFPN